MTEEFNTRQLVQERIDMYEVYRQKIYSSFEGMEVKGFTQEEIKDAEACIDDMVDFYEELLENL